MPEILPLVFLKAGKTTSFPSVTAVLNCPWDSQLDSHHCPFCQKAYADHTLKDLHSCAQKQKEAVLKDALCVCGRRAIDHSPEQLEDCTKNRQPPRSPYEVVVALLKAGIGEMNDNQRLKWCEEVKNFLAK